MIVKFLYKYILIRFGCPLTMVIDQGVHFINDAIMHLMIISYQSMLTLLIIHRGMGEQIWLTMSLWT